ncbi:C6 transcription factor [Pseudohyphozyma bogoriensis]|nr:C6 transcription factor [Pseudohyphozyma bogoriensis]
MRSSLENRPKAVVGVMQGKGEKVEVGKAALRHISTVEALLLLVEWPSKEMRHRSWKEGEGVLRDSRRYDQMSWSFVGCAVRLAQELSLDEKVLAAMAAEQSDSSTSVAGEVEAERGWTQDRQMRAWLFSYNADRHISVRMGRSALMQSHLPTKWWSNVSTYKSRTLSSKSVWEDPALPMGMSAVTVGVIHDKLYPDKMVTRAILRSGQWEAFLRSLSLEREWMHSSAASVLNQDSLASNLLQIEMEYIVQYGNSIALRSWQERARQRAKHHILAEMPLFSLAESLYVTQALTSARSILNRILKSTSFAATFLFKGLATGVVEHSSDQSEIFALLSATIEALEEAKLDDEHLPAGFAKLLRQLHAQTVSFGGVGVGAGGQGEEGAGGEGWDGVKEARKQQEAVSGFAVDERRGEAGHVDHPVEAQSV